MEQRVNGEEGCTYVEGEAILVMYCICCVHKCIFCYLREPQEVCKNSRKA